MNSDGRTHVERERSRIRTPALISSSSFVAASTRTKQAITTNFHSMVFGAKKEKKIEIKKGTPKKSYAVRVGLK